MKEMSNVDSLTQYMAGEHIEYIKENLYYEV